MSNGTVLEYLGRSGKSGYPQNGFTVPLRVVSKARWNYLFKKENQQNSIIP
jgi:hypothetical protein